ncbi:hypothetical protein L598_003400000180 [Mesorhizobium sp. J18]|uniref:hypothetical protein n=1 Tax=Mesorhizobium sp. J18 TaxID=935263 RepID=UPI00119A992D|nr:hypothetical protein [Mesorhizobium sp. J18]TWG94756.1 hypothetical protein L598_003400000180 [Mesorhizobium sp. J18]
MFASMRSRVRAWITIGAGTVAAILAANLLGAFGALPEPEIPVFAAGQEIETGQWRVTPLRAFVTDQRIYDAPIREGQKALVLEVEMTNRTAASTTDYFTLFKHGLPVGEESETPFVMLTRDPSMTPELHPAMKERVAFVWALPESATSPGEIPFSVNTKTYKPIDNLYGVPGWYNEQELGRLVIPVSEASG